MATEMLWASPEGRSRTNSPRQRFHSKLFYKIVRYFCRILYMTNTSDTDMISTFTWRRKALFFRNAMCCVFSISLTMGEAFVNAADICHRVSSFRHRKPTLTEVFPCFFLSKCQGITRKDGARPALFQNFCVVLYIVCFVSFCVLFVCICVLYYCHRVATQLQLTNISCHNWRSRAK